MKNTRLWVGLAICMLADPAAARQGFTKVDQIEIAQQNSVFGITFDKTNWHIAQLGRNTFANYDGDFEFLGTTAVIGVGDMGGLAFADSTGTIFVIDRGTNIVREVELNGTIVGQFTGHSTRNPNDIAYDPNTDTLWLVYFHGIIENRSLDGVLISSLLTDTPDEPSRWSGIAVDPVSDTLLLLADQDDLFEYSKTGVLLQLLLDDEDMTMDGEIVGNGLALDYDASTRTLHMTTQSSGVVILRPGCRRGDFAQMELEKASLNFVHPGWDGFHFSAEYDLRENNDGIDPKTEDVTVSFGTYTETLPAGAFACTGPDCVYDSGGPGITRATISDGFLEFKARHVDLSGTTNRVEVFVRIGNDSGNAVASLSGRLMMCGIGFELAFLVPPLMWLHQRRRRWMQ